MKHAKGEIRNTEQAAALGCACRAHDSARRGIILLFVLGLLALFSLVAVTFVVVARIHKRSTHFAAQIERTGDSPDQLLRQAALQVVRGTNNPRSVLRPHSLLEDLYGSDGLEGEVITVPQVVMPQLVQFQISATSSSPTPLAQVDNYYTGRVLTVRTGNSAGRSWRVVKSTSAGEITVFAEGVTASGINERGQVAIKAEDRILINGAPFNGTGFGFNMDRASAFDPTSQVLLDRLDQSGYPYALLPNSAHFTATTDYLDPAGPGGADEEYDAVDYQNMLLAMRLIDTNGNVSVPIPSLHRPELVNYWVNRLGVGGWSALDPAIARKIILRPIGKDFNNPDHPSFDGGNPNFNPILGPWDVDNDGDGQPDSIWVDLGFPVQTAPDGRIYKPLFAILCEDLDGKLNLNAHGNLNQLAMGATSSVGGGPALSNPFPNVQGPYMTNAGGPAQMLIGQGYGPAEVNLNVALQFQPGEYAKLLTGDTSTHLQGRYGELNFPFSSVQYSFPAPGITDQRFEPYNSSDQIARTTMRADLSSWLKQFEYPDDHFHQNQFSEPTLSALTLSSHGAPPDLDGDGFIGLDPSGNPVYPATSAPLTTPTSTALAYLGMGETLDKWNNPYQLDLSRAAQRSFPDGSGRVYPIDAPFRPEELEVLLRGGDVDVSSLSSRLWTSYGDGLAQNTFTTNIANRIANRHRVTTESWDLPVPSLVPTADMLQSLNGMSLMSAGGLSGQQRIVGELHLANLLKVRGQRDIAKFGTAGADETKLLRHLGPEMKQGLRFDLNRPFGNGRDDNANNVVDEPEEAVAGESIWNNAFPVSGSPVTFQTGILMDHNNDGTPGGPADGLARQIYAKNLYLLLMLLIDEQFGDAAFSGMVGREKLARHVAQWAVNVADFRDRDSIMTGFEYDVLPFTDESGGDGDPWDLDDNLATDESDTVSASIKRGVVWGAERPELLITETLAVHDRRNEDTPNDPSGKKIVDPMNPDDDLDQAVPPQGSLFIEIYNPWSVEDCRYGELYDWSPLLSPPVPQLHLSRTTSNGASPIWRLLVTKTADAPDKVDSGGSFDENNADRVIYFAAASTGVSDFSTNTNTNTKLVTHHGEVVNPIEPGEYLVVGPPGTTDIGTTTGGANDRKFIVAPSDPDHPFSVKDGTGTLLNPYPDPASGQPASIKRVKAASILDHQGDATPVRLSVSEPYTGYPALMATADEPFDTPNNRTDLDGADRTKIWSSGNYPAFRYVHLQRLANPLEPWNAITNPYLTIDSMPIDLTVYNSKETTATEQMAMVKPQPLDTPNFNSRQRDGGAVEPAATLHDNLWAQSSSRSNLTTGGMPLTPQDPTPVDKAVAPNHTFGYLNEAFTTSQRILANSSLNITVNGLPHNYTGLPDPQTLPPPPRGPFPHFHWPNRPFISVYELLNVPAYPSSRLLETHWFHETAATRHYTGSQFTTLAGLKDDRLQLRDIAFRHLMPWFFVQTAGTSPGGNLGPHLYRLFDFVHVSSRFAGTDTYLNPVVFQSGSHDFHPPYNKVSRYREPGKININTIFDQKGLTWQAITNRFPNLGDATFWISSVDPSRRDGLNANFPANLNLDPKSPTLFPNPFRSPSGNFLVPLDELRREGVAPGEAIRPGIDCTLLRRNPTNALVPLLANTTTTPLQVATEPTRNSYFHYQLLQKLGNILTTRSNVYAVWITVGYFEAQRVAVDASHPDGWQLGRELGTDTGEIKRHRAFFMIDRTIPVGFQRGEDLNVQDCFLIQRFIE